MNPDQPKFERNHVGKSIEVEQASNHVDEVLAIAHEAKINIQNVDSDGVESGFLVYPLDKEGYEKRAQNNDFFVTFSEGEHVRGYVMCYDNELLDKLIADGDIGHEDGIINFLSEQAVSHDRFLYGDQIVISKDNRTREAGTILMEKIFEKMREKGIDNMYVAILHEPVRNEAGINFVGRLGFENEGEVTNADGSSWGIYHLTMSSKE